MKYILENVTNFPNGLRVKNCFVSVGEINFKRQSERVWEIKYKIFFYVNENILNEGRPHFFEDELTFIRNLENTFLPLHNILFLNLKEKYGNLTLLEQDKPVAIVSKNRNCFDCGSLSVEKLPEEKKELQI